MAASNPQFQAYYQWLRERGLTYPVVRAGTAGATAERHAKAALLFVGDAPAWTPAERGMLVKIAAALGVAEQDAYFACTRTCRDVAADVVVVFGETAARAILGEQTVFAEVSGKILPTHALGAAPLLVTFHPRDLLLHPASKRQAWADLQLVKQFLV